MAQLIDIRKVTISPRSLTAEVRIDDDAPLFTGDDPEGTDLISNLIPELAGHACFGDGGEKFGDVMANTELAHLLEHVTVELLARTKRAGRVPAGQTRANDEDDRAFELRFVCPDDVLVAGALSSASWIIDWAYNGGGDPAPDVDAIAQGLADLAGSLVANPDEADDPEPVDEGMDPNATIAVAPLDIDEVEPVSEDDLLAAADDIEVPDAVEESEQEPATELEDGSPLELDEPDDVQQDALVLPHFDI